MMDRAGWEMWALKFKNIDDGRSIERRGLRALSRCLIFAHNHHRLNPARPHLTGTILGPMATFPGGGGRNPHSLGVSTLK